MSLPLTLKRRARYAPRSPRIAVQLGTSFLLPDDRVLAATIENVSANGFMARCGSPIVPNAWLGVELPGCGIVRAKVRWTEAGEVGCQFRRPIDLDRLAPGAPAPARGLFSAGS